MYIYTVLTDCKGQRVGFLRLCGYRAWLVKTLLAHKTRKHGHGMRKHVSAEEGYLQEDQQVVQQVSVEQQQPKLCFQLVFRFLLQLQPLLQISGLPLFSVSPVVTTVHRYS